MANYCDYEVRVRGSKQAGHMVYESMPCMDYKDIESERKEGSSYLVIFTGNCKWSVNYGVTDNMKKVNVNSMSESEIEDKGGDYWQYSLRAKSEAFQCEIMVHYWSEESGFDQFDHYKNGKILKQRKIEYNYDEQDEFDWNKLEFVGHEGEYDESVDGEQQNENLMAMLMGLGGRQPQQPEMSAEDEEKLGEINGKLEDLLGQLENLASEAGIDLNDSSIGDTGYDLYNWTFTEGKRQSGKGWSVAIPDGFVVIKSKEDRLFEAVPQGMEENDADSIPVRILPSAEQPFNAISGENWMYHPYARAGVAEIIGVQTCKLMAQMMGTAPEVLSTGFSDICAYIMVQDTSGGSYSYLANSVTEGKSQQIRVQTQYMTDEQRKALDKSIIAWTETFKFDKPNPSMPKMTKFEEPKVINDLKRGVTTSFDTAVERAQQEYNAAVNGRLGTLQYLAENGMLDDSTPGTVKEILTHGMEVKEFYYQKADELVEKLKSSHVNASTMKKVYTKLKDIEDATTEISVDDEKITVELPAKVKEIQKKWKAEASEITKVEKAEAEAERKRKEEEKRKAEEARRKAEAEAKAKREEAMRKYNEAHKKWETEAEAIKAKRAAYVDEKIAAEKASLEATATSKRDAAVSKANAELKAQTDRKATAESTLASLGVFKFGEKKNQKAIIEDATKKISDAQAAISSAESVFKSEMAEAGKKADNKAIAFRNAASKEYPMPDEPKKPV